MSPTIVIESGADEQSELPREVLCSVWPVSREGDQLAIGEPIFSNHMVLVGTSFSERSSSILELPEAGAYLVDLGYPNGHSLRTTISVDEDQDYRLVVQTPKQISVVPEKVKSAYSWVPRVISAAPRRLSARKMDLEVSVFTQHDQVSLYGLYELAHSLARLTNPSDKVFECAVSTELSHEVTLRTQTAPYAIEHTVERKWLVVHTKEKPQTLVAYPSGWFCENRAPFKLMIGRKSREDKWSASLKLTDPVYGSLVEYLTRRDLSSTLSISESERGKAATALYKKAGNPFSAAAAAYLFALGGTAESKHHSWMETLSSRYSWLPDGAIALGWKTLREERHDSRSWEKAKDLFALAWSRGLPYYTVGLHILVDALTLLSRLDPEDLKVRDMLAAAKAADVVCVRTEPFTTLQISRYLGLPMRT
ncbi:MAG: hypothetical protein K2X80_03645 [Pseudomonadaceae bacterium]|nr:hypothetical protein [Pseudomonadaceae bacterium]